MSKKSKDRLVNQTSQEHNDNKAMDLPSPRTSEHSLQDIQEVRKEEPSGEVETTQPDQQEKPVESESPKAEEPKEETRKRSEGQTTDLVYIGTSEKATVIGKVTGNKYIFRKDTYRMPVPTAVDEQDASGIMAITGKPCCGKEDPTTLFLTKNDWEQDIRNAKRVNRK